MKIGPGHDSIQNKVYYRIYHWSGQQCVGSYACILGESQHSVLTEVGNPLSSSMPLWHAAKVNGVTITAEQRTWLEVLEQVYQSDGKLMCSA